MASGFELNEEANRRQILDGMKGGPLFANPVSLPPLEFRDGVPAEVKAAQTAGPEAPKVKLEDPWYGRRN